MQQEGVRPLVTIGVPVYNDIKYVGLALADIQAQTYDNIQIIISDNCSTDGSDEICRRYAAQNPRITYIRQQHNIGPHANFRYLLDGAQGEYFMWAASDDRWDKDFVESLVCALEDAPGASVAFCPYVEIDEEGSVISDIFAFDFSGTSPTQRIIKFHLSSTSRRDAFFYGMFKRSRAVEMRFIKWWWVNKDIAINIAYPPLTYMLAVGDYRFVDSGRPLWFNRIHLNSSPRHSNKFSSRPLVAYILFHLRKINQLYETEKTIIKDYGSMRVGVLVFPTLLIRVLLDCVMAAKGIFVAGARRFRRVFLKAG